MNRTTSAVQPVWWLAPTPRPVSPWKYSWNSTRSRQCGIVGVARVAAVARPAPVGVGQEERRPAGAELVGDLVQVHHAARAGRALDLQLVAVEVVVALERLDQQVVDRKPDRPAPVGVAAEQPGVATRRGRSRRGTPRRRVKIR